MNDNLLSWVESKIQEADPNLLSDYERITMEIMKIQNKLMKGIEAVYRNVVKTDGPVCVSESTVEFCKMLFNRFTAVVMEIAESLAFLREERKVTGNDTVEALKYLGRNVYYNPDAKDEEDDKDEKFFFDNETMCLLIDNKRNVEIEKDVYLLIQKSFEDFFCILVDSCVNFQVQYNKETSLNIEDMKFVLSMWKNTSNSALIQKLF